MRFPWDDDQPEEQTHFPGMNVQPQVPPKGDVTTGRPLADMLDGQVGATPDVTNGRQWRDHIDKTYGDQVKNWGNTQTPKVVENRTVPLVKQAGKDWANWRLKQLSTMGDDGELPIGMGKIVPKGGAGAAFTVAEKLARAKMKQYFPKVEAALERSPQEFNVRYDPTLTRSRGATDAFVNEKTGALDRSRPIDIRFSPKKAEPQTFAHEPLHALLLDSNKKGVFPKGGEILRDRGKTPWSVLKQYFLRDKSDLGHGAIYKVADDMSSRAGHTLPRNSIRPRGGMDVQ